MRRPSVVAFVVVRVHLHNFWSIVWYYFEQLRWALNINQLGLLLGDVASSSSACVYSECCSVRPSVRQTRRVETTIWITISETDYDDNVFFFSFWFLQQIYGRWMKEIKFKYFFVPPIARYWDTAGRGKTTSLTSFNVAIVFPTHKNVRNHQRPTDQLNERKV